MVASQHSNVNLSN